MKPTTTKSSFFCHSCQKWKKAELRAPDSPSSRAQCISCHEHIQGLLNPDTTRIRRGNRTFTVRQYQNQCRQTARWQYLHGKFRFPD